MPDRPFRHDFRRRTAAADRPANEISGRPLPRPSLSHAAPNRQEFPRREPVVDFVARRGGNKTLALYTVDLIEEEWFVARRRAGNPTIEATDHALLLASDNRIFTAGRNTRNQSLSPTREDGYVNLWSGAAPEAKPRLRWQSHTTSADEPGENDRNDQTFENWNSIVEASDGFIWYAGSIKGGFGNLDGGLGRFDPSTGEMVGFTQKSGRIFADAAGGVYLFHDRTGGTILPAEGRRILRIDSGMIEVAEFAPGVGKTLIEGVWTGTHYAVFEVEIGGSGGDLVRLDAALAETGRLAINPWNQAHDVAAEDASNVIYSASTGSGSRLRKFNLSAMAVVWTQTVGLSSMVAKNGFLYGSGGANVVKRSLVDGSLVWTASPAVIGFVRAGSNFLVVLTGGNEFADNIYIYDQATGARLAATQWGDRVDGWRTFTADPGTDELLSAGHGLASGTLVIVQSGDTLPSPLEAATSYYVIEPSRGSFQLSATEGGTAIDLLDAGTGRHKWRVPVGVPDAGFHPDYVQVDAQDRIYICGDEVKPLLV